MMTGLAKHRHSRDNKVVDEVFMEDISTLHIDKPIPAMDSFTLTVDCLYFLHWQTITLDTTYNIGGVELSPALKL